MLMIRFCLILVLQQADLPIVHCKMVPKCPMQLMSDIINWHGNLGDERVVVMERTNFRYVTPSDLDGEMPNFASIDVSFISLKLILPVLKTLLVPESDVVALVKPQFEAGREQVGKKGIVRDAKVHEEVIKKLLISRCRQVMILKIFLFHR